RVYDRARRAPARDGGGGLPRLLPAAGRADRLAHPAHAAPGRRVAMVRTTSGSRRILKWVGNGLLAALLVWTVLPFYWIIANSLKADREIYGFEATLYPHRPTLAAYGRLFGTTPFVKYVRNSTVIAVGNTVLSLVFGCLGAYALARLRFPGRSLIAR